MEALPAVLLRQFGCLVTGFRGLDWSFAWFGGDGLLPWLRFGWLRFPWLGLGLGGLGGGGGLDGLSSSRLYGGLSGLGRDRLGRLGRRGRFGPGGEEGHVCLRRILLAHLRLEDLGTLAGMAQLAHIPHHLGEVVAWVGVVGTAEVGLALEVTVVGTARLGSLVRTLAGDSETRVVAGARHHHGADILSLGGEPDGLVPDAALCWFIVLVLLVVAVILDGGLLLGM